MKDEDLFRYFPTTDLENIDKKYKYIDPHFGCRANVAFPPDLEDLVYLHRIVRARKSFTVLEFGLGYSTFILADALWKNKNDSRQRTGLDESLPRSCVST